MTMKHAAAVETPELDRRSKIMQTPEPPHETLGHFYDWLREQGCVIARYSTETESYQRRCPDCDGTGRDFDAMNPRQHQLVESGVHTIELPACRTCKGERFVWAERAVDEALHEDYRPPEALLADYFGLDLDKIEQERRAILRAINEPDESTVATKRCRGCQEPMEGGGMFCGNCEAA